jgi:dipeptidyl aminopeptidase/acylaminoacyl peptidase
MFERKGQRLILALAVIVALTFGSLAISAQEAAGAQKRRPVTVADAIQMTIPGDSSYARGGYAVHLAEYSPDGTKFVVVLRKGDLEEGINRFSLLLWRTAAVFDSSAPDVILTMASSSNRDAIESVSWSKDNETVAFLGERPHEHHQLYTVNVRTRRVRQLTAGSADVVAYSMSADGDTIAYLVEASLEGLWNDKTRREGVTFSPEQSVWSLVRGVKNSDRYLLFVGKEGNTRELATVGAIPRPAPNSAYVGLSLSPDGEYVAVLTNVGYPPETWKDYKGPWSCVVSVGKDVPPGVYNPQYVRRYELIDTRTGQSRILLNAPSSCGFAEIAWSPTGRSVVIANTYLPAENPPTSERASLEASVFCVAIDIASGQFTKLFSTRIDEDAAPIASVSWESETEITVRQESATGPVENRYVRVDDTWQKLRTPQLAAPLPRVSLEEDLNTPPKLMAEHPQSHARTMLLDLNPEFKNLNFGRVQEIRFRDKKGYERVGGLYYPIHYQTGTRYPLVIQTHGWAPGLRRFLINGFAPTANAAQALAARDILVLQLNDYNPATTGTLRDLGQAATAYEGAIQHLVSKGLIDPQRVGIIGFSYTCNTVEYFLEHSTIYVAAASTTEGTSDSYFAYLLFASTLYPLAAQAEQEVGGVPFGRGLKTWLKNSPGFKINKIHTPLLITALKPNSILTEWEFFAALRRLGKPVEMISLEDGSHELRKPWDQMISQERNVEWFCFWLKGEEDPDPTKAEQYARWHELRKLQEESDRQQANPPPVH